MSAAEPSAGVGGGEAGGEPPSSRPQPNPFARAFTAAVGLFTVGIVFTRSPEGAADVCFCTTIGGFGAGVVGLVLRDGSPWWRVVLTVVFISGWIAGALARGRPH